MSKIPSDDQSIELNDELLSKYQFDSSEAKPNRFATPTPPGGRLIVLEPDIARVFTTAESVDSALRALIATMPPAESR